MPTCTTPLRDDLCAFCRHPSLNESNDDDDKKKKERIKNDFNAVCPACLNCFSFFSCRSSAPSKTASEDKEEEEDNNNKEEDRRRQRQSGGSQRRARTRETPRVQI